MKSTTTGLTRRHVLRGAGVALALPWLESLAPRHARGEAPAQPRRFVAMSFPLGTPNFWKPTTTGTGGAWQLSPILEPLTPVKNHVAVLGRVDQTVYAPNGVQPCNGPLTASFLTAVKCPTNVFPNQPGRAGISIDQRIAMTQPATTALQSLQLGLATQRSYCDGTPCEYSRSISWAAETAPLYKLVDPQEVFDKLVGAKPALAPELRARGARRKSVLDFVVGQASAVERRLGQTDRARLDQYLTSVRDVETRIAALADVPAGCATMARPTLSAKVDNVLADYNRDTHANVMIDLLVMALSCDATRVASFMLDDARSDFLYNFLNGRTFTATGSTPTAIPLRGSPIGYANSGRSNTDWATVVWWYVSKLSLLCQKLAAITESGSTLLDNSVVWFGSGQNEEWDWTNLPVLYVGSGGGALRTDRFVPFASTQSLSNVYLTFLRGVFRQKDASFGDSTGIIPELLV